MENAWLLPWIIARKSKKNKKLKRSRDILVITRSGIWPVCCSDFRHWTWSLENAGVNPAAVMVYALEGRTWLDLVNNAAGISLAGFPSSLKFEFIFDPFSPFLGASKMVKPGDRSQALSYAYKQVVKPDDRRQSLLDPYHHSIHVGNPSSS